MFKPTQASTPVNNGPAYIVWFVPEREGAPWSRIGALWPTKNGKGFRMSLDFVPVIEGSTLVLTHEPRKSEGGEGA